jgi:hypothetical protein
LRRTPFHTANLRRWFRRRQLGAFAFAVSQGVFSVELAACGGQHPTPSDKAPAIDELVQPSELPESSPQRPPIPSSEGVREPPAEEPPSTIHAELSPEAAPESEGDRSVSASLEDLRTRLAGVYRRLYLSAPSERRGAVLAELIADPEPNLRSLGFELAQRELSAGNRIAPEVGMTAVDQLSSPDPATRVGAARLIARVAPASAGPAIGLALSLEVDPRVAPALLRAGARWPLSLDLDSIVRWAEPGNGTEGAASEAAWSMYKAERLESPDTTLLIERLRRATPGALGADGLRLLVTLGSASDRAAVVALLRSTDASLRLAAATACGESPATTSALLEAAHDDAALFDTAVRAALRHGPTSADVLSILTLPSASVEARDAALARLGDEASATVLIRAVEGGEVDWRDAELLLGGLVGSGDTFDGRARELTPATAARAGLRLAELRVEAGQPEAALAALANGDVGPSLEHRALRVRLIALISLELWDELSAVPEDAVAFRAAAGEAALIMGDPTLEGRALTQLLARRSGREEERDPATPDSP